MIEERNDKSLCEKSMKMVVNIIKLSSFSIAKMSLGATAHPTATTKNLTPSADHDPDMVTDELLQPRFPGSRRKLQSGSKPYSVVMQPEEANESLLVHEEKRDIFGAYIRKVHKKNKSNLKEASKLSPFILPPPPTPLIGKE